MSTDLVPNAIAHLDGQQALFELPAGSGAQQLGFRAHVACRAAGISHRQLEHWARTKLVTPSINPASGPGPARLYSFGDILLLQVVRRLLDAGVALPSIRSAVMHLRGVPAGDLDQVTLLSDGVSVYACTRREDVTDIVRGGQGVFGIAIGQVWQDVMGELADLPGEDLLAAGVPFPGDELAARRGIRRPAS